MTRRRKVLLIAFLLVVPGLLGPPAASPPISYAGEPAAAYRDGWCSAD